MNKRGGRKGAHLVLSQNSLTFHTQEFEELQLAVAKAQKRCQTHQTHIMEGHTLCIDTRAKAGKFITQQC